MASCYIVRRRTKDGETRFHVRFESGRSGIAMPDGSVRRVVHVGVFDTLRRARERREWALNEWAAGRVPDPRRLTAPTGELTMRQAAAEWAASRIDAAPLTRRGYTHKAQVIGADFGSRLVSSITRSDVSAWIAQLAKTKKPGTVAQYVAVLSMIFVYAGVEPNPAARAKKPRNEGGGRMRIPSAADLDAIEAALTNPRDRALLRFLEQVGCRISGAVAVRWRDIDYDRRRILIRETKTRSGTRWVHDLPGVAPVDLPERPDGAHDDDLVFGRTDSAFQNALATACRKAGVGPYSPHDLRHRHASRLVRDGNLDIAQIAQRLGHAPEMTISTYTHVIVPD